MEFRPVLSALMRNKTGLLLIAVQVAITLAIVCNSVFIILQRIEKVNRPSGLDDANVFTVSSLGFAANYDLPGSIRADLEMLRSMPGVVDATTINSVPLSNGGWSTGATDGPDSIPEDKRRNESTAIYMTDEHGTRSLGIRVVEGRDFNASDVTVRTQDDSGKPASVLITRALADAMFPNGAVGKQIYVGLTEDNAPSTVVGVIERLQAPWVGWDNVEHATLVPQVQVGEAGETGARYIVRTEPGRRDAVMRSVEERMGQINPGRIVDELRSLQEIRGESYRQDRAMTIILGTVIVTLLIVTGLGIVGMVSFWVTRRTKQIGTRRALGATRFDIRRYFMIENFIVVAIGALLGVVLTYGFNIWLMSHYELPRLAWYYAPLGVVVVLLLGQVAAFGPATRATRVSPAVATRTV